MAIRMSTLAAIDALDAITALLDTTSKIEYFTGAAPANCETGDSGTKLGTTNAAATAFGAASDGTDKATAVAGAISDDVSVDATGTPGHFRFKNNAGTVVLQGTVTITSGGGDIEFDSVTWIIGGVVTITDFFNLHLSE